MAKAKYEYSTSPKKIEVQPKTQKKDKKKELKVVKDLPRQEVKLSKEQKKKQVKLTVAVIGIFVILLTISYRNSQINESFNEVQTLKKDLALLEKENEQLKVTIENGLNLNNIEKLAKEKLGMQKLTNKQTVYVALPKKDYIEPATEEVIIEKEESWIQKIVNKILDK